MWIKTADGGYYNMLTGTNVDVKQGNAGDFRVMVLSGPTPIVCLQKGYREEADARDALDDAMASQELVELAVPDYEEEDADDSEESEEDGEPVDNYDEMSNDELRDEITKRNEEDAADPNFDGEPMSTQGNKKALIGRLRADDGVRASGPVTV